MLMIVSHQVSIFHLILYNLLILTNLEKQHYNFHYLVLNFYKYLTISIYSYHQICFLCGYMFYFILKCIMVLVSYYRMSGECKVNRRYYVYYFNLLIIHTYHVIFKLLCFILKKYFHQFSLF